ncbi:hypothetical protein JXA48_04250 [Candidatus Woesearchaeota archaeon]|nr:hypothetical protein [Candidatus Woesearchaeota archaeon]
MRHFSLFSAGTIAGFLSTGSLASGISVGLSSYIMSLSMGPSKKAVQHFYDKHINQNKHPNFKVPKRKFSSKSLTYGSLFAAAGILGGSIVHPTFFNIIKESGLNFSSLDSDQIIALKEFGKIALTTTPILFSTGLFFGDSLNYIKSEISFDKLVKSTLSLNPDKRLELIISNVDNNVAGSSSHLISELYNQGRANEALSYFLEYSVIQNSFDSKISNPLALATPLILDGKKFPLKFCLANAISESLPVEYVDGLVEKIIDESIQKEDTPALALSGFYLENKKDITSQKVWEEVGLQLSQNKNLESKLFAKGTSQIESINLSGNNVDIIKSTLLRKIRPLNDASLSDAQDEKILNNTAYSKFISDSSLDIPLLLYTGKLNNSVYSLLRLNRSSSLFEVAKTNPNLFNDILVGLETQTKKINSVYEDAFLSKEIVFSEIDYSNRFNRQENTFGKDKFSIYLAKKLLERIELTAHDVDFLKPSIDNLPEQWLYDKEKGVFSRLDFENKGRRRSMEDRVNSSLWV